MARVFACAVKGSGRPWVGGDLVLTNRRLIFSPLNVKDVAAVLSYGSQKFGAPSSATTVVGWINGQAKSEVANLSNVVMVVANRSASLLNPPTIIVSLSDSRALEFGVLDQRMSLNGSKSNERVRDELLHRVQSAL